MNDDHGQMFAVLFSSCEHWHSQRHLVPISLNMAAAGNGRPGGHASVVVDDEPGGSATCAETVSVHDLVQCGGFVIFSHVLHRSFLFPAFLPLLHFATRLCSRLSM